MTASAVSTAPPPPCGLAPLRSAREAAATEQVHGLLTRLRPKLAFQSLPVLPKARFLRTPPT